MTKEKIKVKGKSIIPIIIISVTVAIIVLIIFFGRGKTTVTGQYPEDYHVSSLSCSINGRLYPIFTYDYSNNKNTEIKIVFGNTGASTFYLRHTLYYSKKDNIIGSEAHNIAALYKSFAADGLEAGALGSNFSKLDDRMQFTLFAPSSDITQSVYKYFLLDRTAETMTTIDEFKRVYEKQGFSCTANNEF